MPLGEIYCCSEGACVPVQTGMSLPMAPARADLFLSEGKETVTLLP